jgi:hypothetical protein
MTESDTLQMAATLVNKWSGPLAQMRNDIRSFT